jgi:Phosphorylated CTD interacting factor 1 WW domain.
MMRGEKELLSIMDEMARGDRKQPVEENEEEDSVTNCPPGMTEKIRLIPEIEGYGDNFRSCLENGKVGYIWNPYVSVCFKDKSLSDIQGDGYMPPTCPYVEVARRRAYENFKKKFYAAFKWIVENGQSQKVDKKQNKQNKITMESIWKELPSHSILERFYFAFKVDETFRIMQNRREKALGPLPKRGDVIQITRLLDQGNDEGYLIDPILLPPFQKHRVGDGLLKREIVFQFTREWKRATKGKDCDDLPTYFSSKPFQKRCSKITKMINDLCVEAESNLMQDLKKKASETILNSGNKKRNKKYTPKLLFESQKATDSDDSVEYYTLTFSGLSFRVGKAHFEKLQRLFDRHNTSSASIEEHHHLFLCDLFALLARYDLLEGAGLQSSISGNVFDVLLKHFGCNFECFASPFNCRYGKYYRS